MTSIACQRSREDASITTGKLADEHVQAPIASLSKSPWQSLLVKLQGCKALNTSPMPNLAFSGWQMTEERMLIAPLGCAFQTLMLAEPGRLTVVLTCFQLAIEPEHESAACNHLRRAEILQIGYSRIWRHDALGILMCCSIWPVQLLPTMTLSRLPQVQLLPSILVMSYTACLPQHESH